jgi:hypothetical protein
MADHNLAKEGAQKDPVGKMFHSSQANKDAQLQRKENMRRMISAHQTNKQLGYSDDEFT